MAMGAIKLTVYNCINNTSDTVHGIKNTKSELDNISPLLTQH